MNEIEEIDLTKVTELLAGDYIRGIRVSDGMSVDILKSDLDFDLAQITGLVAALAGKIPQSTLKNQLGFINSAGNIIGSSLEREVIYSIESIDSMFSGIYTSENQFDVEDSVMGYIKWLIAFDDTQFGAYPLTFSWQLVVASRGVFLREYAGASWSNLRYVGGAQDCLTYDYADIVTLAGDSKLTPGAPYKITGTGQNNGIIIRAASASELETDGLVLGVIPKHSIGTHSGIVWKGHWADTLLAADVSIDDIFIYYGKCYGSVTGEVGTATNRVLDATNWYPLDPLTETDYYTQVTHGCSYKLVSSMPLVYPTGFIYSRWDAKGNTLSEIVEDADGFNSDMNDWHLDIDGGEFNGNILRRIYNNTIASGNAIMRCSGNGDIYNTTNCDIVDCVLPDETNNIRNSTGSSIVKCVLGGTADIQYLASGSNLSNNTINGDVKGDAALYSTITLANTIVTPTGEIKDNGTISVTDSVIGGTIDGVLFCDITKTIMDAGSSIDASYKITVEGCRLHANGRLTSSDHGTYKYLNSVIDAYHSENLTADITIAESRGRIISECYVGTGTFVIANGAAYVAPSSVSGCVKTNVRTNGITQNGTTLADATFTAIYAGWYRVRCIASAHASFKCNFKTICYVNSTPQQNVYNEKNYTTAGDFVNSIVEGSILLAVGDVVSFKFQHSYASPITITLGQITANLEYNN